MSSRRAALLPILPALALLAACGGGDDASLSLDDLGGTGDTCPVDLDVAVAAAGLDPGGEVEVDDVLRGSGDGDVMEDPAIDQWNGVYVECSVAVGDSAVAGVLFAAEEEGAINLLLPQIVADLGVSTEDVEVVGERFADTDEGDPVDLGADGPAAAARIAVDGAGSAVLYVSADEGAASPAEVREVLAQLLDDE